MFMIKKKILRKTFIINNLSLTKDFQLNKVVMLF